MMYVVRGKPGKLPAGGAVGVTSTEQGDEPDEAAVAADLVRRIAARDEAAENQLVQRYQRGLRYFLRHLGAPPELAEDLAQETFQIALERLRRESLTNPAGLSAFLRGTARNLLMNERRKTWRRRTEADGDELDQAVAPAPSPLQAVLQDEEAAVVRRMIAELPTERDRQLLLRFYVGEEDKASLCADLGVDSLHFNRVLFRARQRFKDLLERSIQRQPRASHDR
jgi:RNA polymerase sigma-70 factor (ECF subfamily)